jgi:hypothetical protein
MTRFYVDLINTLGDCHSRPTPDGLTFEDAIARAKADLKGDIANGCYEGEDLSQWKCEVVAFDEPGEPRIVASMPASDLL